MTAADPITVAIIVAAALESCGLRYVIGGSVASSVAGEPRSTLDVDLMIERDLAKTMCLVEKLATGFYVDADSARDALAREGSFNAIHYDTSMKVDFFIAENKHFAQAALHRRREITVRGKPLFFYAVEDLVIRKLLWFQLGGESSERQWRDVVSLLRLNATVVDEPRLRSLAAETGVVSLLDRAIVEAAP